MGKIVSLFFIFCNYAFASSLFDEINKIELNLPYPKLEADYSPLKTVCPKYKEEIQLIDIENPIKDVNISDFSNLGTVSDDLDRLSLLKALEINIKYWKAKPDSFKVKIGSQYYSADHMLKTSQRLFDLFSSKEDLTQLGEIIGKEFKIYKAVSDDADKTVTITGYYESEIKVTKEKTQDSIYALHAYPYDLVKAPAGSDFDYGRYDENGKLIPYYSTEEIRKGAIDGKAGEIAFSAHPSQIMLAQIQGSSILRYPDGDYIRVGFAGANGRKFTSVQKILMDCGEIPSMSFKDFIKYLSSQPQDREERLVNLNPRYIFFAVKDKDYPPYGAMGYELTPQRSIAIDPQYIPLGITGYLKTSKPVSDENGNLTGFKKFSRFMTAQDTGSAIRGPGRIDLFWGSGKIAETEASSMKAQGEFYIFVLK
ncbi:MAG: hypothetical protein GX447_04235 [Elusimicrobia bacterium]|nr:hypothetical protein [Elusimicrobiota bacterium]